MELEQLGDSDLRVSRVGLGCNNFGGRTDLGATRRSSTPHSTRASRFFDTAEHRTAEAAASGCSARFSTVVATRSCSRRSSAVGRRRQSARLARSPCARIEGSLERLRTDHVDLYYLHKPDPATPIAETLGALDELVREGKVRAIGCSNFSADQLAEADRVARELGTARFVVVQNRYSLLERGDDEDVLPLCRELGISYIPYFPLASGLLTGKYRRGEPAPGGDAARRAARSSDERFDRVEALETSREKRGHTLLELAVAALASTPGIRVGHRGSHQAGAGARQCRSGSLAARARRARRARPSLKATGPADVPRGPGRGLSPAWAWRRPAPRSARRS